MTRRLAALLLFNVLAFAAVAGLFGMAAWQVQRRAWKLELIERIETRARAAPVPAPGLERWSAVSAATDEYRRVAATGRWLGAAPALVQATTELGGGYWVMSLLVRDDGATILINRGFVPADRRDPSLWVPPPAEAATATGLLRISEPGGGFLRSNDPAADRWYSRDVQAIARSRGLKAVAPYFIDLERTSGDDRLPVAGLTVLTFSNNHLIYAVTWGVLALMAACGTAMVNLDAFGRLRPRTP